jgi:hypothetical protein
LIPSAAVAVIVFSLHTTLITHARANPYLVTIIVRTDITAKRIRPACLLIALRKYGASIHTGKPQQKQTQAEGRLHESKLDAIRDNIRSVPLGGQDFKKGFDLHAEYA